MPTLQFKGKTFVQNHHLAVPYHQLVPRKDLSLTDKVSLHDNLIIHGDNLIALKALLPTYAGKVDCIYIDPPYNTGNEKWIYNDNVNSPYIKEWIGKVVDKDDLTRHDKWLCMMMPRIKILIDLLSEEGILFMSIDDVEVHHAIELLQSEFGERNYISCLPTIMNLKGNQDQFGFAGTHEYTLVVCKNRLLCKVAEFDIEEEEFDKWDEDDIGPFIKGAPLRATGNASKREDRPFCFYPILIKQSDLSLETISQKEYDTLYDKSVREFNDDFLHKLKKSYESNGFYFILPYNDDDSYGRWRWGYNKKTIERLVTDVIVLEIDEGYSLYKKQRPSLGDMPSKKPKSVFYKPEYSTSTATSLLKQIFGQNKVFEHPKPVDLLKDLVFLCGKRDCIVLDSFAGTGTTAHAVLQLNKEDNGTRKFILIELEDYANKITAERVRRVIKGIPKSKNSLLKEGLGGTFSYFELGDEIELYSLLNGKHLPSYKEFARYLFYTATGDEFDEKKINEKTGFIGENKQYKVFLFYKPDTEWLKKNALTKDQVEKLPPCKDKQRLVFAPAKYVDDETLRDNRIDFCQLPYEIYRMKK